MFCINPVLMCVSLAGAVSFRLAKDGVGALKKMLPFFAFPVLGVVINPLFVHKGVTPLFILNNNPVTLEAVLFGLTLGIMICSTVIWFSSFNSIMTTDKLLYVFGSVSPKIALILSMTLRYIPLYGQQIKKIRQAQQVVGLYKEDNAIDKIRGGMRIFSVMVSWALENGIITADSMTARGYGVGRRSRFSIFGWQRGDKILTAAAVLLGAAAVLAIGFGRLAYEWYPQVITPGASPLALLCYAAYALLGAIPTYLQLKEEARWRSLQSKI
jgi:energy-coupling factor transport system permease protein